MWNEISAYKFFQTTNLFVQFTHAYLFQIALKIHVITYTKQN